MAYSPSHKWEDGVLVERAIDTRSTDVKQVAADEPEVEDKAVKKPAARTKKKAAKK